MTPLLLITFALGQTQPSAPVGRSLTVTVGVSPGAAVEARPQDDRRRPLVVQSVVPVDGGYAVTLYGLDPGVHPLADVLRRADGSELGPVRPSLVQITSSLPVGQVRPADLEPAAGPRVGGYRTLLIALGVVWGAGLLGLVASFFLPRRRTAVTADKPVSLADRLRPLVAGAAAGTLARDQVAELERTLTAYWRTRRGWNADEPHAALAKLHADAEAGPLLKQLEAWLHRPAPQPGVDVAALLAPYRDIPPDAVTL